METLTGKGRGILLRLPHFYDPDAAGSLLLDVVDTAGRSMERAEADLYRVLRAHHVQTADNEAAEGYTAPLERRGELDRILALYLEVLGGTSQLVKVSPALTARSIDARALAAAFERPGDDPLRAFLWSRFSAETRGLLERWRTANAWLHPADVGTGMVMALLTAEAGTLAAYVLRRLTAETRALLDAHEGGPEVDPALARALARDLNDRVLGDPQLYPRNAALFDALPLAEGTRRLRGGVFRAYLASRADAEADPAARARLLAELEWADTVPTPPGPDLVRLNRLLLEAAWRHDATARPWGLEARGVPSLAEVRDALVAELNGELEKGALARPELFPELEPGEVEALVRRYGGRKEWVGRALLERGFPRAIEPSYAPYRERLLALIQVLRRGASTRRGIVDVVAANLGILGDDPEARRARELIRVVEYDPERRTFYSGELEFWGEVTVESPNLDESGAEFRVAMLPGEYAQIANVRLTRMDTRESVEWPGRMRAGDALVLRGGMVTLNGIAPPEGLARPVPPLPKGRSRWRFDADVVVPGREAGQERELPVGRFDPESGEAAIFDAAVFAPSLPAVAVEVVSVEYTPGTFTVMIPWNIPGFTDKFEAEDHPRNQIRALVEKVKAAGVESDVAYHELFREEHAVDEALKLVVSGKLLGQVHEMTEAYRAESRQSGREDHEAKDTLLLSGVFDYTRFDSGNGFA